MGLSVRAFRNVAILSEEQANANTDIGALMFRGALITGQEEQLKGMLQVLDLYEAGEEACYIRVANPSDVDLDVYDGSCIGYAAWRSELAGLAVQNGSPGDFDLLVNFSDQIGMIGTAACDQLYCAFQRQRAAAELLIGGEFYDTYVKFHAAFELARQGGCVTYS